MASTVQVIIFLPVCVRLCLSNWLRLAKAFTQEEQLNSLGFCELGDGPGWCTRSCSCGQIPRKGKKKRNHNCSVGHKVPSLQCGSRLRYDRDYCHLFLGGKSLWGDVFFLLRVSNIKTCALLLVFYIKKMKTWWSLAEFIHLISPAITTS